MLDKLHYWPKTYIETLVVAFLLAAILTPVAARLLRRAGVVDAPSATKIHTKPTPRGGGVVIFLAFAVAVLLPNYRDNPMKGVIIGAFVCMLVGLVDDIRGGVPAVLKLLTLVFVTVIMAEFGVKVRLFQIYWLDVAVTIVWIAGVTSAFNGLDNMDGLASGTAAIVSGMFFLIALQAFAATGTENALSWFGLLAAGLMGATLGFLIYNFKPAAIFMGDSGSFSLGFTLASLGVMGEWAENRIIACTIPVLILGVPLFDFAYIIIARILRGDTRTVRSVIEHCAPDHLSHRLCWIGFSQRKAVLFIYLVGAGLGVTGVLLRDSETTFDSVPALLQGFAIVLIVMVLMHTASTQHIKVIREEAARLVESLERRPRRNESEHAGNESELERIAR